MSHSCPGGIKTIKGKQLNANHFPFSKSGYQDSNLGPPAPKAGALTGLRYTPFYREVPFKSGAKIGTIF